MKFWSFRPESGGGKSRFLRAVEGWIRFWFLLCNTYESFVLEIDYLVFWSFVWWINCVCDCNGSVYRFSFFFFRFSGDFLCFRDPVPERIIMRLWTVKIQKFGNLVTSINPMKLVYRVSMKVARPYFCIWSIVFEDKLMTFGIYSKHLLFHRLF